MDANWSQRTDHSGITPSLRIVVFHRAKGVAALVHCLEACFVIGANYLLLVKWKIVHTYHWHMEYEMGQTCFFRMNILISPLMKLVL